MRLKIATFLLMAGTVVGCASNNPPPPPPMAEAPPPAPAPAPPPVAVDGTYRGTVQETSGARGCRAPKGTQTARVRNNVLTLAGQRAQVAPDGTVTPSGRGSTIAGNIANGTLDVNVNRGHCTYHYTLNHT